MDEILYLEPDEEITSVIDKLRKSRSKSVGLVIPRNSGLIHSIVNLKLLKKEAEQHKSEIALITTDKIGRNIATQVGLLVYEDVHAKKPVNARSMPAMPKGDEVIEVDMSGGKVADDEPTEKGMPNIRHYSGGVAVAPKSAAQTTKQREAAEDLEDRAMESRMAMAANEEEEAESAEDAAIIGGEAEEHETHSEATERASGGFTSRSLNHEQPAVTQTVHREVREMRRSQKSNPKKGMIVAISIFLIIALGTLLGLPQSTILVTVAAETFEKTNTLVVEKDAKPEALEQGTINGRLLETTNSDARRVVATGKKDVGGKAKGAVTFYNAWDGNPIKFTSGTVLTAGDGKTFTLDEDVTVPGGTAALVQGQLVTNPGKANGNVTAAESGEASNAKAGRFTISTVASERQAKIYAESSKDFTGGFTKQVNVMTQQDIDTAKDELVKDLSKSAIDTLKKEAKTDKVLEEAIVSEIDKITTNPEKADTETDYFDIKVEAKHQLMVFDEKQVNEAVNGLLQKDTPDDKELLLGEGDEFSVGLDKVDYGSGKMSLTSKVKTKVGTRVDVKKAREGLAGKSEAAIKEKLQSLPNLKDVTVHSFPGTWWQDTSFFAWNTRLRVIYE